MKTIPEQINEELEAAFAACGVDTGLARAVVSNRPDLCEYQCNGALAAAKSLHRAPLSIAEEIARQLAGSPLFEKAEAVRPGFLNLTLSPEYLVRYLEEMREDDHLGCEAFGAGRTVVMDYGGPNVAKPLHVGHLRSAIIGECLKRLYRFTGHEVIADVHLGDWGLQMGLIIEETRTRHPGLVYFDPDFTGPYPTEAPFTLSDLEEIYPTASRRAREDPGFAQAAHDATVRLQKGDPGYHALFEQIRRISVEDLRKNYERLSVRFDVWKGESDVQSRIPGMLADLKESGLLHESQGALVVDVAEETDPKEIPPCILRKSDGASLYATTDLATLVEREELYHPDEILYVVDKRQEMHFTQVFRTARRAGIIRPETRLTFLGFGTMNGKDGKPFKTREGGVMRLEQLIDDIDEAVRERMQENHTVGEEEARAISETVGLAALKYGDLSNQASKNYVFDVERFTSFEGNTGPYLLYTMVRIKSILSRVEETAGCRTEPLRPAADACEKDLQLRLTRCPEAVTDACQHLAPHKLCQYVYEVSDAFNVFYHEHRILTEPDRSRRAGWIALLRLTLRVLETCIDLLGFEAPDKM